MSLKSKSSILLRTIRQKGLLTGAKTVRNFLIYWLYKKFQINGGLLLKKIQGSRMYLDVNDPGLSKGLAIHGVREEIHTKIIKRELEEGMTVVDIGANIGYYVLIEALIVAKKGRVYAIEPSPGNFELLNKNIKVNNYTDIVQPYNIAISDRCGKARLYLSEESNLPTMLNPEEYPSKAHADTYIEVQTTTLDDFLKDKEPVDLIRMDVEGYEVEIFDGMLNTLQGGNAPRKILFEAHPSRYTPTHSLKPRLEMLLSFGYKPKAIMTDTGIRPQKLIDLGYEPEIIIKAGEGQASYKVSPEDFIKLECPPNPLDTIAHHILLEKED